MRSSNGPVSFRFSIHGPLRRNSAGLDVLFAENQVGQAGPATGEPTQGKRVRGPAPADQSATATAAEGDVEGNSSRIRVGIGGMGSRSDAYLELSSVTMKSASSEMKIPSR